jgi:murein DD-endopeptidase MepM/ murein hydrolase activator NlpD
VIYKVIHGLNNKLNKRITVMLIPHGKTNPLKINVSILFMCGFIISWTALTVWSGYLVTKHLDYIKTKIDNKIMHARLLLFANQIEKVKNMFEKAQGNDEKIRLLLAMGTKKSILEEGLVGQNFGKGGPTLSQISTFAAILSSSSNNLNYSEISHEAYTLYEQYKFMCRSYEEIISYIRKQKLLLVATPSGWPCKGHISSVYGFRVHPIFRSKEFHPGLDIANKLNTSISSTAAGSVVFSGYQPGYGNVIAIDHGQGYRTVYAHLSKRLVNVGTHVSRGNIIAKMGNTGASTGSHLHYEVHFKENRVNPKPYLANYPSVQSEKERYVQKKIKKFA